MSLNKHFLDSLGLFERLWGFLSYTFDPNFLENNFLSRQKILEKASRQHAGSVHLVSYSALLAARTRRLDHQHNFSDREKKISSIMVTVQDAGLAVFRVVRDEETSEDKIEWLLLQSSK